jgi:hypothetical protein
MTLREVREGAIQKAVQKNETLNNNFGQQHNLNGDWKVKLMVGQDQDICWVDNLLSQTLEVILFSTQGHKGTFLGKTLSSKLFKRLNRQIK